MIRHLVVLPTVLALYMPFCGAQDIRPRTQAPELPPPSLWVAPADLADRDLYYGPWAPIAPQGALHARSNRNTAAP